MIHKRPVFCSQKVSLLPADSLQLHVNQTKEQSRKKLAGDSLGGMEEVESVQVEEGSAGVKWRKQLQYSSQPPWARKSPTAQKPAGTISLFKK